MTGRSAGQYAYCLTPLLTEIPEGCWVCPNCIKRGVTTEAIKAKPLQGPTQPVFSPKFLQSLQGAVIMAEAKGRKMRSSSTSCCDAVKLWQYSQNLTKLRVPYSHTLGQEHAI